MTVQACMLMNPTLTASAKALNAASVAVGGGQVDPRIVDNPLANNLGLGQLCEFDPQGKLIWGYGYLPARLLNNPSYGTFYDLLKDQPIYTLDSDILFAPQPEV